MKGRGTDGGECEARGWQGYSAHGVGHGDQIKRRQKLRQSPNCGLRAYDNWINGLAHAKGGRPGFGTAYNAACWADYPGSLAVPFLREAKDRVGNERLAEQFDDAIKQYSIVAAQLEEVATLFPLALGDDGQMDGWFKEDIRRQKGREALQRAKVADVAGTEVLKCILQEM